MFQVTEASDKLDQYNAYIEMSTSVGDVWTESLDQMQLIQTLERISFEEGVAVSSLYFWWCCWLGFLIHFFCVKYGCA